MCQNIKIIHAYTKSVVYFYLEVIFLELRVLKYFLIVAREENITRAAKILHITQPTLSRQLMQLEEELDTTLFIRGKSHITLTDEGMILRKRAEELVELAEKTEKEFLKKDDLVVGEIFIGGGETNAMHLVAKVMKEFHQEYPQVKYKVYSGNANDVQERLDKGLLDIGLLTEPVNIEKYDFMRLPQKDRWGILLRSDDPLVEKGYVEPKDLANKSIMCSTRSLVQNELASWFGKYFEDIDLIATYNLIYNASVMAQEGIGYAICLEKLIQTDSHSSLTFLPFYPAMETGVVIVWKKHQIFSKATSKFLEKLQKTYK